jgi:hypothetical protein
MSLQRLYDTAYGRAARAADAGQSLHQPAVVAQRAVQDAVLAERHRGFDRAAQDRTPKYHRKHFAVVGEGTRSATDKYRAGWSRIFGGHADG